MKIVGISSNGGSQESVFYLNTNRSRGRDGKTSFQGQHESLHSGHHQHESQPHGMDKETLKEEEVVEVVVEVIEVNNQITIQTITIAGNLSTWQKIVIKGSMMHEMESYNKGIMHQLAIKVMSNCL